MVPTPIDSPRRLEKKVILPNINLPVKNFDFDKENDQKYSKHQKIEEQNKKGQKINLIKSSINLNKNSIIKEDKVNHIDLINNIDNISNLYYSIEDMRTNFHNNLIFPSDEDENLIIVNNLINQIMLGLDNKNVKFKIKLDEVK